MLHFLRTASQQVVPDIEHQQRACVCGMVKTVVSTDWYAPDRNSQQESSNLTAVKQANMVTVSMMQQLPLPTLHLRF